jgi:uncharacterized membrane protein YfcA
MMDFLFGIAAFLYSLAGHGGASAYTPLALAAGMPALEARGVALLLNLMVAGMAGLAFGLAGQLRIRVLLPLLLGAMPLAFFGSRLIVKSPYLSYGLAFAMLWAAWRFTLGRESREDQPTIALPKAPWLAAVGAGLGLLSGLTGVGGGIYLSPLLLFKRWATAKEAAALAACFIWFNSAISLTATGIQAIPRPEWIAACLVGGLAGATLGSRIASPVVLRRALGCVLLVAAFKALVK